MRFALAQLRDCPWVAAWPHITDATVLSCRFENGVYVPHDKQWIKQGVANQLLSSAIRR